MPGEEEEIEKESTTSRSTIVRLTGLDKWEDWHMSLMCSLMDNDLDEELGKDVPDPAKNKKIYTRIGGSIAGEATKLLQASQDCGQGRWSSSL